MKRMLYLHLLSDTTIGSGEGVAGLVGIEIEHDPQTGLPFINGRRIKGLLVEECANLLYAAQNPPRLYEAARRLFGEPGSTADTEGVLKVGSAGLSPNVRQAVQYALSEKQATAAEIFEAMTAIRRQTAVDDRRGAPAEGSLRSMRVIVRGVTLEADLEIEARRDEPTQDMEALLAACAQAVQRAGVGRNRGRGHVSAWIESQPYTAECLDQFAAIITEGRR